MEQCDALFFDGKSARPQHITLKLDRTLARFSFLSEDGQQHHWPLTLLKYRQTSIGFEVRYGEYRAELLRINDRDFVAQLEHDFPKIFRPGWYERFIGAGLKMHLLVGVFALVIIVLAYIYTLPWLAEKAVYIVPESYDRSMGEQYFDKLIDQSNIDPALSKALTNFAQSLDLEHQSLRFYVINDKTVNAFALPGGIIMVNRGILEKMNQYEALVALLGHEVAHINQRHSMKMLSRNLSGYIFISVLLNDVNGVMAVMADNIQTLRSLSYSRAYEAEADQEGLRIMHKNKVASIGMVALFEALEDEKTDFIPDFLLTHPMTAKRKSFAEKAAYETKTPAEKDLKLMQLFTQIQLLLDHKN